VLATQAFYSRKKTYGGNQGELSEEEIQQALEGPMHAGQTLGIGPELWKRDWAELSGGEGQRIMLAIGASLGTADILLFDGMSILVYCCIMLIVLGAEPTSALDIDSTLRVEEFVTHEVKRSDSKLKAIVWITHSEDQARRVGNRYITVAHGTCHEDPVHPV
jgi:ABC-type iron transport system FetAB ATPase subunit